MSLKEICKSLYLRGAGSVPHKNIYSFHHLSMNPEIDLSDRKIHTDLFYYFIDKHAPYVSLKDLLEDQHYNGAKALTFDDGLEDLYTVAYPYLSSKGIPFTAFILSEKVGLAGYITKDQLEVLANDPLVTIGSHGTDHVKLTQKTKEEQWDSIMRSKEWIEDRIGKECTYFAYPSGEYNEDTLDIMKESGYEYGFAVKGRTVTKRAIKKVFEIPRLSVHYENAEMYPLR